MKVVKLTRTYSPPLGQNRTASLYNVGEVAGFPDDEADQLIAQGWAVEVNITPSDPPTKGDPT